MALIAITSMQATDLALPRAGLFICFAPKAAFGFSGGMVGTVQGLAQPATRRQRPVMRISGSAGLPPQSKSALGRFVTLLETRFAPGDSAQ